MAEELKQLIDAEGVKKIWERTKEYVANNAGGGNVTVKKYELSELTGANWLRIAKVSDITKNSSGIFTFDCYGVVPATGSDEIMTTSVFNVSCGIDDSYKFVADVMPISQAPELTSSDASGGGSATGSEGSVYGLASITVERYEDDIYVCGLINYPSTDQYIGMKVEMKIENNLNFTALDALEVVNLDEVNEEEMQVLEGTTLSVNKSYEFRIGCNLQNFIDGLNNYTNFSISAELYKGEPLIKYGHYFAEGSATPTSQSFVINNGDKVYSNTGNYNIDTIFTVSTIGKKISLSELNYFKGNLVALVNDIIGRSTEYFSSKVTKLACLLRASGDGAVICRNGVQIASSGSGINLIDVTENDVFTNTGSQNSNIGFIQINSTNTDIEITIPYQPLTETVIESYTINNNDVYNFQLKYAELTKHYTTSSYDLFSVYNKLEKLEENIVDKDRVLYKESFILSFIGYNNIYKQCISQILSQIQISGIHYSTAGDMLIENGVILSSEGIHTRAFMYYINIGSGFALYLEGINPINNLKFTLEMRTSLVWLDDLVNDESLITEDMYTVIEYQPKLTPGNNITIEDNVISATGGVESDDVLNIIEENASQVDSMTVGTADNYDTTSDTQIPTTKAVKAIVDSGSSGLTLYDNWEADLTNAGKITVEDSGGGTTDSIATSISIDSSLNNKYLELDIFNYKGMIDILFEEGTKNIKMLINMRDYREVHYLSIMVSKYLFVYYGVDNEGLINKHIDGYSLGFECSNNSYTLYFANEQTGSFGTFLIEIDETGQAKLFIQPISEM